MNHLHAVLVFAVLIVGITPLTATYNERFGYSYNGNTKPFQVHKIKIKVFYEALCPGSINFFTRELQAVVEKLSDYLDLKLVPYGFAKTLFFARRYSFLCQHGPLECFSNKMHACVIGELRNNTEAALVNACLMKYTQMYGAHGQNYKMILNWCTYRVNVRTDAIWRCLHSVKGAHLLRINGDETKDKRPPYVPYVEIYGAAGRPTEVTGHLMAAVCGALVNPAPPPCLTYF